MGVAGLQVPALSGVEGPRSIVQSPYPMQQPRLILASRSPRRRQLLTVAGFKFDVVAPDEEVECGICSDSGPAELVQKLALSKAANVRAKLSQRELPRGTLIVAADTLAECDGQVLGKPRDAEHARAMLTHMSGRVHRVLTGLCLWPLEPPTDQPLLRVDVTTLRMDQLSEAQLDEYLDSEQWQGKAGAFGYQDRLGWVHIVLGSETNVVGLPMELLEQMLVEIAAEI